MDRENNDAIQLEGQIYESYDEILQQCRRNVAEIQQISNILKNVMESWHQHRCKPVLHVLCHVVHGLYLLNTISLRVDKSISEENVEKERMRHELMENLTSNDVACRSLIRMGTRAFLQLCYKLRETGMLKDYRHATVEEQVAKFLHILGQNFKNHTVSFYFQRSNETTSRHFHNVLRVVISMEDHLLKQPNGNEVPSQILKSNRFYPFFKDCVCAIDGTHVRVKVHRAEAVRFRGRKQYPTQNVLAACDFDMKFTYVLPGWEGTASDSRILKNALTRSDRRIIPQGKYYLVDAGFPLRSGLLAPYRGVRYHLKEYSRRGPENARELFNHRHASLRNTIERTFGVLKKRFPIIASGTEPNYSFETMTKIVLACCILHNFLMGIDPDDSLIAEVDQEQLENELDIQYAYGTQNLNEEFRQGSLLRDNIATQMWNDYQLRL